MTIYCSDQLSWFPWMGHIAKHGVAGGRSGDYMCAFTRIQHPNLYAHILFLSQLGFDSKFPPMSPPLASFAGGGIPPLSEKSSDFLPNEGERGQRERERRKREGIFR